MARTLEHAAVLDVLAAIEIGLGVAGAALFPPALVGVAAPAAFTLRWIAGGCDATTATRAQFAVIHDYLLLESLLWTAVGATVVGATTVEAPVVGTIGSAAIVSAIGALLLAAAELAGAVATGRQPTVGAVALLPLTPLGRPLVEPLLWLMGIAGLDVDAVRAAMASSAVRSAATAAAAQTHPEEHTMADPITPMLQWQPPLLPPGNYGAPKALARVYSHAYQAAADETYQEHPSADLRPWLIFQSEIDMRFLRAVLPATQVTRPDYAIQIRDAIGALATWHDAAVGEAPGAWSRSTVRQVLRSFERQQNLPVVVVDETPPPPGKSSAAAWGLGALGVLGYLLSR